VAADGITCVVWRAGGRNYHATFMPYLHTHPTFECCSSGHVRLPALGCAQADQHMQQRPRHPHFLSALPSQVCPLPVDVRRPEQPTRNSSRLAAATNAAGGQLSNQEWAAMVEPSSVR